MLKGMIGLIILILIGIGSLNYKKDEYQNLKEEVKKIRKLDYYSILDESNYLDLMKRKEIDKKTLFFLTIFIVIIILALILIAVVFKSVEWIRISIVAAATMLSIIVILFSIVFKRYYSVVLASVFYIPTIVGVFLFIYFNKNYQDKNNLIFFLVYCIGIHIVITLCYTGPYLIKLDKTVTLYLPLVIAVMSMLSYIECIDKDIVSLLTSMYAVGIFLIKKKLKYHKKKAEDIYKGILSSRFSNGTRLTAEYEECKKCVFYGGESFKNRILENEDLYKLIEKKESNNITSKKSKMSTVKEWLKNMISS